MSKIRLSVRTKILALAGLLVALMLAFGLVAITKLGAVEKVGESMYADRVVPRTTSARPAGCSATSTARSSARSPTATGHHADYNDISGTTPRASTSSSRTTRPATSSRTRRKGLAAFQRDWKTYQTAFRAVLSATKAQDPARATRSYFEAAGPALRQGRRRASSELGELNDREAKAAQPRDRGHGRLGPVAGACSCSRSPWGSPSSCRCGSPVASSAPSTWSSSASRCCAITASAA